MLAYITWDVDPELFSLFGREIRWYGFLWATGILLTSIVVQRMYKFEKLPDKWFDSLFMNVIVGLIIGARLGHCLFYDPVGYLSNPIDLLKIWEGGLASHGGAIGMVIGVCTYSLKVTNRKVNRKHLGISSLIGIAVGAACFYIYKFATGAESSLSLLLYQFTFMGLFIGVCVSMVYNTLDMSIKTLDRLVVGVAIGATFIRLGNLMNSEIYGGETTMPWGFRFITNLNQWRQGAEPIYTLPSHPTQIYEASIYFIIFLLGLFLFYKTTARQRTGLILGISLIGIFLSRFFIEFLKNVQEPFEIQMIDTIGMNMGQLLSIPFILWGAWLIYGATKNKNKEKSKK